MYVITIIIFQGGAGPLQHQGGAGGPRFRLHGESGREIIIALTPPHPTPRFQTIKTQSITHPPHSPNLPKQTIKPNSQSINANTVQANAVFVDRKGPYGPIADRLTQPKSMVAIAPMDAG
jgi:hypothetical protein